MYPTMSGPQKYYFSSKIKKQLNQISQYPLTVVEAPSGFGKTTAVREYLRNEHPQAVCEWYTCLGEPASVAWTGICELFAGINSKAANDMKNLSIPTMDTLPYIKAHLKHLKCRKKTYLVIDNFHLINFDIHRELIGVFSMHESPNLHMIFIMQQLDSKQRFFLYNNNIHAVDASSFFFGREGIAALLRMEGLRLSESELDNIFRSTEGWISAIRMQIFNYRETGSFVYSTGIEELVETSIWDRLEPIEKDFLLMVSVFDSFTSRQAAYMLDYDIVPGEIETNLKTSDFITFLPDQRLFIIHSILLNYLRNRFYYYQPKEYQNQIFYKAGVSCAAIGDYCLAAKFFYKVMNFDAIMSLPFTRQYLDAQKENCEEELFAAIIRDCPEEILCKYPYTTIVFAHYALLNGQYDLYEKLCKLLGSLIREKRNSKQEETRRLTGELILLESLGEYNNLSKIREGYEAVSEIWEDSSDNIPENSIPWLTVFPTAFGMLWCESGKLDEVLRTIDELKPIYRKFSRGQGTGLSHLIRAEVMLARGDDNEAEILSHKALYVARAYGQTSICIYAELCLARIFILRGDTENFSTAIKNIQKYPAEYSDITIRRMVDLCLSIISLLLGIKDYVAPWLYNIEDIRKSLYAQVIPFAEILHFRLLLIDKRYNELYAVSQLALDTLRNPETKIRYVMPQIYHLIFLAVVKHNSGDDLEAGQYLKEALDIALPDQIYLPFADHKCMTDLLSGLNAGYFNKEKSFCSAYEDLLSLCKRQVNGICVIKKALLKSKSPLTPREREIALLAKKRLSAKEIAAKLYISEKTVKSTRGSVYSKLEIHSRSELASREF